MNGSTLSVGHAIAGKYGTLTLNADGHYTYISNKAGPGGVDTFTYSIDDGHGGTASSSLSIFDQAAAQVVQHSQIEVAAKAVQSLIGSDTFWVNLDNAKQLYDAINTVYSLVKDDISFVQFENQLDALQAAGVDGQFIASWRSLTSDAEANIIMADSSKALPELWKVVMDKTVDIVIEHLVDDQLLSSSDRPFAESLGKTSVNLIAASALGPAALPGQLWDQSVLIAKEIVGLNLDLNGLVNDEIRNGLIDISYFDQSNTKTNPKLPALIDQQISSMTRIGDDLVNGATNLLDLDAGYKIDLVSFLLKARVDQLEGKQTSAVADVANAQSFAVSLDAAYGLHDNPFAGPLNNHFENFATLVADNYHIAGWHV